MPSIFDRFCRIRSRIFNLSCRYASDRCQPLRNGWTFVNRNAVRRGPALSCTTTPRAGIEGDGRFTAATFHSTDPDHFISLMPGGSTRLISTPGEGFQASLTRVTLRAARLQHGNANMPALVRLAPSPAFAAFAFISPTSAPSIRETMLVTHRDISVFGTEQPVSTRWLGACEWFTIAMPIADFVAAGRALLGEDMAPARLFRVVQPRAADLHRLRGLHEAITRLAVSEPEALAARRWRSWHGTTVGGGAVRGHFGQFAAGDGWLRQPCVGSQAIRGTA